MNALTKTITDRFCQVEQEQSFTCCGFVKKRDNFGQVCNNVASKDLAHRIFDLRQLCLDFWKMMDHMSPKPHLNLFF